MTTPGKPATRLGQAVEAHVAEDPEASGPAMSRAKAAARQVDVHTAIRWRRVLGVEDRPQVRVRRVDYDGGVAETSGPTHGGSDPPGHIVVTTHVWEIRVEATRAKH